MKNSRIKKQWARAVKKRRTQENRRVREVAAWLLGGNKQNVWNATTEQWELLDFHVGRFLGKV
jgi:hypothetical protein